MPFLFTVIQRFLSMTKEKKAVQHILQLVTYILTILPGNCDISISMSQKGIIFMLAFENIVNITCWMGRGIAYSRSLFLFPSTWVG